MTFQLYSEWYTNGPAPNVATYPATFAAYAPPGPPAVNILYHAAASLPTRNAYCYLGAGGVVEVVHRIAIHAPDLALPSPADTCAVGILNERTPGGANYVLVPREFFHVVQANHVRSPTDIAALLAADGATIQFPAAAQGDPNVTQVDTRRGMLIPHAFVGRFLERRAAGQLTIRFLWEQYIAPELASGGVPVEFTPFLDWCRVAISAGAGANNPLDRKSVV